MNTVYLKDWISAEQREAFSQFMHPKMALLIDQIIDNLSYQHGDAKAWLAALAKLPEYDIASIDCTDGVYNLRSHKAISDVEKTALRETLMQLSPWRKGPFNICGVGIDSEWRSNIKWQRIAEHVDFEYKSVIDVGCGNGYYAYRMLEAGAANVLGVDPSLLFNFQYYAINHFARKNNLLILPVTLDEMIEPDSQQLLPVFDVCLSMGVLYHRRSPFDHLLQLKHCLKPGGELVLETLVIEGDEQSVFIPQGRYAGMGNVWFLPSVAALHAWLRKCGFIEIETLDVSLTTIDEQRKTEWMKSLSLDAFLQEEGLTIEGYKGPLRAVIKARRK